MAHQAQPDQLAPQATKDQQVTPAASLELAQAQLDHQAPQANPANPVPQVVRANQAKMEILVLQVLQEMLVPQAHPAKLVVQAQLETLANKVHPAAANIAHPLVLLQVIKLWSADIHRRQRFQFSLQTTTGNFISSKTFHVQTIWLLFIFGYLS